MSIGKITQDDGEAIELTDINTRLTGRIAENAEDFDRKFGEYNVKIGDWVNFLDSSKAWQNYRITWMDNNKKKLTAKITELLKQKQGLYDAKNLKEFILNAVKEAFEDYKEYKEETGKIKKILEEIQRQ